MDSRVRFASGEVQNLVGFVPSRMAERAAKTPRDARAEKIHTVLARIIHEGPRPRTSARLPSAFASVANTGSIRSIRRSPREAHPLHDHRTPS